MVMKQKRRRQDTMRQGREESCSRREDEDELLGLKGRGQVNEPEQVSWKCRVEEAEREGGGGKRLLTCLHQSSQRFGIGLKPLSKKICFISVPY